ncbi:MAG: cupin domain-containing protein [Fuerstiella sp.]|nr:cupin domain-containing protein [Fuerstiella sp.]
MSEIDRIAGCPTVDFAEVAAVACPCGQARRGYADVPEFPGTIHVTDISEDARIHYHKTLTETYYILECGPDAAMELDGKRQDVRPGWSVVIPPGTRHRAVGKMKVLIVVLPEFDPADEWFD